MDLPDPAITPSRPGLSRSALALGAFYFAWLGALGLFLPYFSLWLRARGLSDGQVSRVFAISPLMGSLAPPLIGLLADARRARPWLLRGLAGLSAAAFALLGSARSLLAVVLATALFSLLRAPLTSLCDAAAAEALGDPTRYGRMRLWGSLGFLLMALGAGPLLDRLGIDAMPALSLSALVVGALVAWAVPAPHIERHPEVGDAARAMWRDPLFRRFLVAVLLSQAAGAAYDSCFSLHLAGLGMSRSFVGLAWSVGVAAEIVLLATSHRIFASRDPLRLFTFAIVVSAARWAAISVVTSKAAILALQPLHAITFALWYSAAVQLSHRWGRRAPTAAQGLLTSSYSLGGFLGMMVWGELLARGGGALLFRVTAALALVAAAVAWSAVKLAGARSEESRT